LSTCATTCYRSDYEALGLFVVLMELIELSDLMILHRFNSPGWLKHLRKVSTALASLSSTKLNSPATAAEPEPRSAVSKGGAYGWTLDERSFAEWHWKVSESLTLDP
jgi:hypothetical protein